MKELNFVVALVFFAGLSISLFSSQLLGAPLRIRVMVSILPLKYLVQKICEDKVQVSVMIPPGANPHSFEPKPEKLKDLSQSSIYVKVGTPLEFEVSWMKKLVLLNKKMVICDSSEGIPLLVYGKTADPHIWTSLRNDILITANIKNTLVKIDPANRGFYEKNCDKLKKELELVDQKIEKKLKPLRDKSFIVFHSAWNYFARDYNLKEIPVEIGGKEPAARDLVAVIKKANRENIKVIFVAPQFSKKSAQVIAKEIGGRAVQADDLSENIVEEIKKMAENVVQSYGK